MRRSSALNDRNEVGVGVVKADNADDEGRLESAVEDIFAYEC